MILDLRRTLRLTFFTVSFMIAGIKGYSQAAVRMTVQNAVQTDTNKFEYDIMLTNIGADTLRLRAYSTGINHATGLANGGVLTHTYVSRDASLATIPVPTAGYTAATNHLRMTTTTATAGNEVLMTANVPIRIATMRVTSTVAFAADFNPGFVLQVLTQAGKTQCVATCYVSSPTQTPTNFALFGTGNPPTATSLNVLTGVMNIPCFYLNPTGTFTAASLGASNTPVTCFGGSNGSAQITLSSTGSAAPAGTVGTYKINADTTNYPYTGNPFSISNLSAGIYTVYVKTSYGCIDTVESTITQPTAVITSSFSATGCDSLTLPWNTVVNTSGAYTHTYVTASSCDSIVTANITINSSTINTPTTATACNTYLWSANGLTYTASGTYLATFLNISGCDSNHNLLLTINNSSTSTQTTTSPGSYTWAANSVTYTLSGTYTSTFVNSVGCDSIATLILTISGANFTLSVVEDLPISCFGNNDGSIQATATGPGTYTYNLDGGAFTSTTGLFSGINPGTHTVCATDGTFTLCDTISFIEPPVLTLTMLVDSSVSCLGNDGQISAVITGGTAVLQPYLTTWTNSASVLLNPTNNSATIISGLPVGMYYLLVEDDQGCFRNDSISLGLVPALTVTASNTAITCNGGTSIITASATGGTGTSALTIGGLPIAPTYPSGTYTITATDAKGCTATSSLIITEPAASTSSSTVTNCDSYTWTVNSLIYTVSGTYTATLTNASNCDSIVTLNLTINNSSINPQTTTSSCVSYTWAVNGVTYTTSGIKTASYTNAAGCDSSYVLNLTINPNTTTTSFIIAPNIYLWPASGLTYTASGVYTHTSLNANGCVQTSILDLTINLVAFTIDVVIDQEISCFGNNDGSIQATAIGAGPFTYILDGGVLANTTGFFDNLTPGNHVVCALAGVAIACDTIFLTEPPPLAASFFIDSMVSCKGNDGMMTINITGGTNILQGYLTWWTNAAGDTINDILSNNFALDMDSLAVGPYTVNIEDDHGCFFAATGIMIAAPPIVVNATYAPILCFGGTTTIFPTGTGGVSYPTAYASTLTYSVNGTAVAVPGPGYPAGPGTYTIIATDYKGCADTNFVTITAPTAPITSSISVSSCDSYLWTANNTIYTNSGVYTATVVASNTCDSIITMTLTINNSTINAPTSATACNTYTWSANNVTYTMSGTYLATFLNASGCDSNHTLLLTINNSTINPPTNITVCDTYTWSVNSTTYTASGNYVVTFLNVAGCDSSYTLNLIINTTSVNNPISVTACNSYTWSANSVTYTSSGTYTASFLNASNCDSISTLVLVINQSSINAPSFATECNTFTWGVNGLTYTNSGTYTATFNNVSGCDSSYTLNLIINTSTINNPYTISACNNYTWPVNGFVYSSTGTYIHTYLNVSNCVSTHTLNLTINTDSINAPTIISACNSYTWGINSVTYTASGTYVFTYLSSFGCNASSTLQLTINNSVLNPPVNVAACNSYLWPANGLTYTMAGSYTASLVTVNGCDSNYTLNLTINTNPDVTNTTLGNATSVAGSECDTKNQTDGSTNSYYDANCKIIATIQDAAGGNTLSNVTVCAVVLSTVPVYTTQPYLARYFTIAASSPGSANVTFYLTQDDFNDYNANVGAFPQIPVPVSPVNGDTTTLCISQVPQTSLPGAPGVLTTVHQVTAIWNASASRWEIVFPVAGFGGFYLHACNPNFIPLPAMVTSFTGRKGSATDILEWTTSSEQNNSHFNLEHSTDGINFSLLAKVNTQAAGGNSSINLNYIAENMKPSLGHNYYRLQQVDFNGNTSYESHIVDLIWGNSGSSVSIYPNPTSDVLNIDFYSEKVVNTNIKVLDMSGRTIKQILVKANSGMNNLNISLAELASGIYTIQIFENDKLFFVEKLRKNN